MGATTVKIREKPTYVTPAIDGMQVRHLAWAPGMPNEARFAFFDRIEIHRHQVRQPARPGILMVHDPTVSSRHCIITRSPEGIYLVRDVSRNGTRVDGRRLVPNVDVELQTGQLINVSNDSSFVFHDSDTSKEMAAGALLVRTETVVTASPTVATVLVGDVQDFTELVQLAPPGELQRSVRELFAALETEVVRHGGTVKEHHGDAIFAFWEAGDTGNHTADACHAAMALHHLVQQLANNREVWQLEQFPLKMDFALSTGTVIIDSFGGSQPVGLSMIGEAVVLAFRIEKIASAATGSIITCAKTQQLAASEHRFRDIGHHFVKGFSEPLRLYALEVDDPA